MIHRFLRVLGAVGSACAVGLPARLAAQDLITRDRAGPPDAPNTGFA